MSHSNSENVLPEEKQVDRLLKQFFVAVFLFCFV